MLLARDEAKALCDLVLSSTKADAATVVVRSSTESHARFADNNLTTSGRVDNLEIGITVWIERRRGSAATSDASRGSLFAVVQEAERIARVSPVDREFVEPLGPLDYPATDGYADRTVDLSLPARARVLAVMLDSCRSAGVVGAGFHDARGETIATATSGGNFRYFRSSLASLSVTARTKDGTGSGYFASDHFNAERIDHKRIVGQAIEKARASRGATAIEPGAYRVILEPQAVADLVSFLTESFDARTADEGRSAFSGAEGRTKLGERLFDERIHLYSDPAHTDIPEAAATDEGVPAARMDIVRAGVLQNLVYSRFWAHERGKEPTPGPVNFILEGGGPTSTVDEMIKATDRGLLITRFWYVRLVNPRTVALTGLTRDGVWLIENGRVRHPVGNLRFNQSVLAMLGTGNVEMIGASERRSPMMIPALKLKSFLFTSQSDAV